MTNLEKMPEVLRKMSIYIRQLLPKRLVDKCRKVFRSMTEKSTEERTENKEK